MAEKKATQDEGQAEGPKLIKMTHEASQADDLLSIGKATYEVVAGHVEVAPEHIEAATAAGFRLG